MVERNMSNAGMRGIVVHPASKAISRAQADRFGRTPGRDRSSLKRRGSPGSPEAYHFSPKQSARDFLLAIISGDGWRIGGPASREARRQPGRRPHEVFRSPTRIRMRHKLE